VVLEIAQVIEVKVSDIQHKVYKYAEKRKKGVYVLLDKSHRPLYVGRGTIRQRLPVHLNNKDFGHNFSYARMIYMKNESDIIWMEEILISILDPIFNIAGRLFRYSEKPKYTAEYNKKIQRQQLGLSLEKNVSGLGKKEESEINESYQAGFEAGSLMGYDTGFDEGYEEGAKYIKQNIRLFV
jgi:hypothetical protein